jgi:hypothetical protein
MAVSDWREHATPEAQQAFADAQYRLDNLNFGEEGYTPERAEADKELTDQYDRLGLQPAQDEFERQCEAEEFARHFPEPPDGSRIEWEGDRSTIYAAQRTDFPEHNEGSWWMYGDSEHRWSWRQLVCEYNIPDGLTDVALLVEKTQRTDALEELARWLVSLDDPDPTSAGFQERRTVTMTRIIERARQALGEKE